MTGSITETGPDQMVLGIDIGTTHSAVSLCYSPEGQQGEVLMVSRWAGQPEDAGNAKIPTIVAYKDGKLVACGAEARQYIDDEEYDIAKWFKLYLNPQATSVGQGAFEIPLLPSGVTLKTVYTDFLRYIFESTKEFFGRHVSSDAETWNKLQNNTVIVLSTPNNWDTAQQRFLRTVAIQGGLVSENDADRRLEFVTESEASVHFILKPVSTTTWLKSGCNFMVVDAGGSTVDSVLYKCEATRPKLMLKEVRTSECVQAGGVCIDRAMELLLQNKLVGSNFDDTDSVKDMVRAFEEWGKRVFDGSQETIAIKFGGKRDTDRDYGIVQGRITLTKQEVASTFDPAIKSILESCQRLMEGAEIQHLLLVGGFGESPFLRKSLESIFKARGTRVLVIDEPSKKAAAEGSALWFQKQLVSARASRFTIGDEIRVKFQKDAEDHRRRESSKHIDADGQTRISGKFKVWIRKGTIIEPEFKEIIGGSCLYEDTSKPLRPYTLPIYAWEGPNQTEWITNPKGELLEGVRRICTLSADLSSLVSASMKQRGEKGRMYRRVDFKVLVMLGGTQLRAKLQWEEKGKTCEGPVGLLEDSVF